MAKISIEFDTKTKELTAAIDGKAVANVVSVQMYPSWDDDDEFRCVITTAAEDEETDIKSITNLVASETPQAKTLIAAKTGAAESVMFPGFVESKSTMESKALKDIVAYFGAE